MFDFGHIIDKAAFEAEAQKLREALLDADDRNFARIKY